MWLISLLLFAICLLPCGVKLQQFEHFRDECANVTGVNEFDVGKAIFPNEYYGTWQRPVKNAQKPIIVNLTFSLSSINDVIERDRVVRLTAYLALRWFDEIHVWNETFPIYCVPYIVLPANDLWRPDVAQMNSQSKYSLMDMPGEKVRLHSNGFTTYSPGGTFEAFCDFDFTMFPFDSQNCSIMLESWRYTHDYVTFQLGNPSGIKIYQFSENDQWQLTGSHQVLYSEEYTFKEILFDRVVFYIYLKRKAAHYLLNIVVPSMIISLAQIATFSIGAREPAKLELSFTCLLAYSVFQLQVVGEMPRSSDRVPFLSIYIDLQMFYIALSMLGQGIIFVLLRLADDGCHGNSMRKKCPHIVFLAFKVAGRLLGVKEIAGPKATEDFGNKEEEQANSSEDVSSSPDVIKTSSTKQGGLKTRNSIRTRDPELELVRSQWIYISNVVDRWVFTFYVLAVLMTPLAMMITASQYNSNITTSHR